MERSFYHVKKNDMVQVMSGKDKGKVGKVLRVNHKHGKVVVEKVNVVKRHKKPTGKDAGGIVEMENPIPASKVLLYSDSKGKGVRGLKLAADKPAAAKAEGKKPRAKKESVKESGK